MITIYFSLDEEGYLTGWGSTRSNDEEIALEVEREHEVLSNPEIFKYVDGELVRDSEKEHELTTENKQEEQSGAVATKEDVADLKRTIEELKQIILNA